MLAAILSTADTVLLTAAGILEYDIMKRSKVSEVRLWTIVIGAIGASIALFHTDVIALLMKTYNGYTAGLVPALFVALILPSGRRVRPAWAFIAIAGGYALGIAGSFTGSRLLPLLGMVFSAATTLTGAVLAGRKSSAAAWLR